MTRLLALSLGLALLLITAHRLPAPIQEIPESQTPAPEKQAKPKKTQSNSKAIESESKTKSAAKPSATPAPQGPARFAGTWTGTTHGQGQTIFGNPTSSSTYSIQVSSDEKTLSVDQKGNYYNKVTLSQIACRRQGDSLNWSYEGKALVRMTGTCTLRLNADGSAGLVDERKYRSVDRLILKITGTLMRQ
jgi:cytoskeletal protein RodZ